MPGNRKLSFPHHTLEPGETQGTVQRIDASLDNHASPDAANRIQKNFRNQKTAVILLIHGTFVGDDLSGAFRQISRIAPAIGNRLRDIAKVGSDQVLGERGNFTSKYANALETYLNPINQPDPLKSAIEVKRFLWSGENHHLGRLDGVMRLTNELHSISSRLKNDARVLAIAHSHGGNLLALLSLIANATDQQKTIFFRLLGQAYRPTSDGPPIPKNESSLGPGNRSANPPEWERAQQLLLSPNALPKLDIVTLGTPLRYRWNLRPTERLLHLIHHRVIDKDQPLIARIPRSPEDLRSASSGDFIQQLGIGGSDFRPPFFAVRERILNAKLARIFESTVRRRDYPQKLRQGRRVSSDGSTLLIDYSVEQNSQAERLLGHGVYTDPQWIPMHMNLVTEHFANNVCDPRKH